MSNSTVTPNSKKWAIVAAGVGLVYVLLRHRHSIWGTLRRIPRHRANTMEQAHIEVISSLHQTRSIVNQLKEHSRHFKVLGFDCEWITVGGSRRPVALLQLSSHQGLCALFRLCCMKQIPKDLRDLLEDEDLIKVGVAPQDDAMKLSHDFGVGVASTFDLRYMAVMAGHPAEGLGKLSKTHLDFQLDKSWRLACSNWEAPQLTAAQLNYAAYDALAAVAIFKKLSYDLQRQQFWDWRSLKSDDLHPQIEPFLDVSYSAGFTQNLSRGAGADSGFHTLTAKAKQRKPKKQQQQCRNLGTQSKAFYDNCLLQAPDGELLCTIDRSKAAWYLTQNLGTQISEQPFTVRLNFEPAGRAVGDVGRYYQTPKENQCVVCGRRDAYLRKNVVPREYRKHFPTVMKSHSSHDILLLCPNCHQTSNISDHKIRSKLATICEAPLANGDGVTQYHCDQQIRSIKSAGRALLHQRERIPSEKVAQLEKAVLDYYKEETEISEELLKKAANLDYRVENDDYCQHGKKVVQMYCDKFGGLVELERLWREHFLNVMRPRFLPQLWNVNHNADRLEVRASEGRVTNEDLAVAGLDRSVIDLKDSMKT
ncbi:exonuclease 3'-5' domain-containing protein 2 [Drosophila grimshawi]|uniref:Exonuclease 3'-5' domain-containing protein 2 n=1 Tax=Drosophila grimshawi TaxID=7222 RepID=B4JUN9_DROGR|nr:exonuclease 3'-5' domain-containing protein 2 [Drosophila grimshawi]EDV91209.1 GH15379 [Drosophila grimshawi]